MSQYDRTTNITENYEFDIDHAGIIIGKKGSGIKSLMEIPGAININLDTESSLKTCFVKVQATENSVCELVCSEIQRRISKTVDESRRAILSEIFIETKENENEIQVKIYDQQSNMPILFVKDNVNSVYIFYCFSSASLESSFSHSNNIQLFNIILDNILSLKKILFILQNTFQSFHISPSAVIKMKLNCTFF